MGLNANQTIRESDFINDAEADPIPANDENKLVKLEADAKIASRFVYDNRLSVVAYEDIDKDNIVFISTSDSFTNVIQPTWSHRVVEVDDMAGMLLTENLWVFNNEFPECIINSVGIVVVSGEGGASSGGTNYGLFTLRLYSVDESNVPVTLLGTATKQIHTWSDRDSSQELVFGSPVAVSGKIAISVVYTTTDNDSLALGGASTAVALAQLYKSGSNWFTGLASTPYFRLNMYLPSGRALVADKDSTLRARFDGVALNNALAGQTVVINSGKIFDRLTGITPEINYYLGNNGGLTATENDILVGIGITSTSIKVKRSGLGHYSTVPSEGTPVPSDGFLLGTWQHTSQSSGNYSAQLYVDGELRALYTWSNGTGSGQRNPNSFCVPIRAGSSYTIVNNGCTITGMSWIQLS